MPTPGARPEDPINFYGASLESTKLVLATAAGAQTTDGEILVPGKYLVQALAISDPSAEIWILTGPFVLASPIPLTTGPGDRRIPLSAQGLVGFEFNVLLGVNDRLGAITTVGTADVYITHVSRIH